MNRFPLLVMGIVLLGMISFATAQSDDWRDDLVCADGDKRPCGGNIGICKPGERVCATGKWGECAGGTGPQNEVCDNRLDDDCNGQVDDCSFEFPVPGWMLIAIGVLMLLGAWVYEKMVVVKREVTNQEEPGV